MNRTNGLYFIVGGLGPYIFHEESKPDGIEMSIGKNGVSIEEK